MSDLRETDLKLLYALLMHGELTAAQAGHELNRHPVGLLRRARAFLVPEGLVFAPQRERKNDPALFALGPRGREVIAAEMGIPERLLPLGRKPSAGYQSVLYRHRKLVTDVRIAAHVQARKLASKLSLMASLFDRQLTTDPTRRSSQSAWEKLALGFRVKHPFGEEDDLRLVPDALLVHAPPSRPEQQMVCLIECDRGSEQISEGPITAKFMAYLGLWINQGYTNVPEHTGLEPKGMRVLFVIAERTQWRIKAMRHALRQFMAEAGDALGDLVFPQEMGGGPREVRPLSWFGECFRFTEAKVLAAAETCFYTSPIWTTLEGNEVPLFRGLPAAPRDGTVEANNG